MIIPVDITLEQLRALTKAQIISRLSTWLMNNFTKRQLILWLMDMDVIALEPLRIYRADGQIASSIEVTVDIETAKQVNKRVTNWSYYPTGEVNEIIIRNYDGNNILLSTKIIKHYTDGKKPTVMEE